MSLEPLEPQPPGSENLVPLEPQPAQWSQVFSGLPQQPGLAFIQSIGGAARGVGDLLDSKALGDWGAIVARTAKGASADLMPAEMSFGQQAVSGGIQSFGQMLPFMFAGGPAAGIIGAGLQQSTSRYSELRDYGFGGGRAAFHAGIDGLAEMGGEMLSFPVLFKQNQPWLRKGVEFLTKDLVGEELTTLVEGLNAKFSDQPNKTAMSFLDDAIMTAAITPIAGGLQVAAARAIQGAIPNAPTPGIVEPPPVAAPPTTPLVEPSGPNAPVPVEPEATPAEPSVPKPQEEPTAPTEPEAPGPAWMPNSFAVPPDEQLKTGQIDLTLYNEFHKGFVVASDGTSIMLAKNGTTQLFTNYQEAAAKAAEFAGFDLTQDVGLLNSAWTDRIAKNLFKANPQELSSSTLQFIEGLGIKPLIKSLMNYRNIFNDKAVQFAGQNQHVDTGNAQTWGMVTGSNGPATIQEFIDDPKLQVTQLAGSQMTSPIALAMEKKLAAWTKHFGLDTKIILDYTDGLPADHGGQMFADVEKRAVLIRMNSSHAQNPKAMVTLAHEFGHAIALDTLSKAEPAVQLKIMRDWAQIIRKQGDMPTMTGTVAQLGVNRIMGGWASSSKAKDQTAQQLQDAPDAIVDEFTYNFTDQMRYFTSFQEHLADQVAQYMFDNKLIYTAEERSIFEKIVARLKEFYASVVHKFEPNMSFYEFLDTLRSNAALTGLTEGTLETPLEPIEPDMGKLTTKKQGLVVNEIPPGAIKYWETRRAKMLRELERVLGEERYDTILEELDPTGLVVNFDFERAIGLLEMHGADPKLFMSREVAALPQTISKKELERALQQYGQETDDSMAAGRALGEGAMVFTMHEMDEKLIQITKSSELEGYDNFIILPKYIFGEGATMASREAWVGPKGTPLDETYPVRAQLNALQTAFPGLGTHLTPAREGVKSFGKFLRTMLTAVQVRKRYGGEVPAIKQGIDGIELMEAYKAKLRTRADDRVKQMKTVGRAQREKVFGFMIEEDKRGSWLSEAVPNTGDGSRMISPEIAKKFGITEAGANLYKELRKDFWDALKELEHLRIAQITANANSNDPQSLANLKKTIRLIQEETSNMLANPYVPHTRFGNYYTQVVNETTGKIEQFYQFEHKGDAKKWAEKLRKEGQNASAGMIREDIKAFAGLPPSLIQSMRESLNLTEEQSRAFEDILKNMSSGQSFVRKMKKRKDIPGWTDDEKLFPQVYADYMTKFANHAGRLKFTQKLKQSELDLKQMIRDEAMAGRDTTNLGQLLNWLQTTNNYALNPTSEFANLRGAVTLWYLGFGVKSAVVNGLSVPMVTYPYLAKRFGDARGIAAISRAYSDLARSFAKPNTFSEDEKLFLEAMRQENVLDESYSAELAGLREGGKLADTLELSPKGAWSSAKFYGMWMFHKVEMANRYATALAAYRLARTQTAFTDEILTDRYDHNAKAFAKQTVQDTQNVNAQWNRSEFTRGGKSVFTMFMSYQQNLIFQMFGGDQSWMRLLAAQLLVAGAMGLPFAKDADNLIKWFARKVLGEDFSVEGYLREMLSGIMDNPNWVLRGGSYNVFGTDLQGSLGMGQVIPGLDALAMEGSFAERLANAAPDIGGPAAATMISFMQAMADNNPDNMARFSRMLPAFGKQASQGWVMLNEGIAKNSHGDPITEVSQQDALKKMLGFQSSDVSTESAKRFAQKDSARYWLAERQYVMEIYYAGIKGMDSEMRSKALEALYDYNDRVPNPALKIGGKELKQSVAARIRADTQTTLDMPKSKRDRLLYEDIASRY